MILQTLIEFALAVGVVLCFVFEKKLIAFENRILFGGDSDEQDITR